MNDLFKSGQWTAHCFWTYYSRLGKTDSFLYGGQWVIYNVQWFSCNHKKIVSHLQYWPLIRSSNQPSKLNPLEPERQRNISNTRLSQKSIAYFGVTTFRYLCNLNDGRTAGNKIKVHTYPIISYSTVCKSVDK